MSCPPSHLAIGNLAACLKRMDYGRQLKRDLLEGGSGESAVTHDLPLADAVRLFEKLSIGYALAGSVAAMYYGRARFTEDVDFVAVTGHQQVLQRNPDAMRECHFDPTCTRKLYHESGTEVDIWKDEYADDIVARAVVADIGKRSVRISEVHDLVAMKLRAGRIQDDYDISEIAKRTPLDQARLAQLITPEQLTHFHQILTRQ